MVRGACGRRNGPDSVTWIRVGDQTLDSQRPEACSLGVLVGSNRSIAEIGWRPQLGRCSSDLHRN
jgi:hypothetical protein